MDAKPFGLLWLDLETSGLSPTDDLPLEVAARMASFDSPFEGGVVANFVVRTTMQTVYSDTEANYAAIVAIAGGFSMLSARLLRLVFDMHTKSGLLQACSSSDLSLRNIEERLLEAVPELPKEERVVLAGSTIHFDHSFIARYMPRLDARLSHRHYDVSAIKLFCQSLGMPKLPKAEAHRALADVDESIAHARACRDWLHDAWTPPGPSVLR